MQKLIFETEQRVRWYIQGIGKHGLTPDLMLNLTTERICELYNVELNYFRP